MPSLKPNSILAQRARRALLTVVALYLLLCAAGCALQRRLIYFPTKLDPRVADQMAAKEGFQPWRNQANELIGWKLPATGTPSGSVLVVHGNAGCALHRDYFAKPIHQAASFDVYVLEYPGYGARSGSPSMKSFLTAGEEAFEALPTNQPTYVVSESLGTGVAAHLARTFGRGVAGLIMFAPYNNLVSVGQRQMPFLPVGLLLRERFNPAEWLKDYSEPIGFVIAGSDEIIPPDLGRKFHDGHTGPKRLQIIEGARHNNIAEQSPNWWREIFAFWQGYQK